MKSKYGIIIVVVVLVSLLTGIILGSFFIKEINSSKCTSNADCTNNQVCSEGKCYGLGGEVLCGGITGIKCPSGYQCVLYDNRIADSMGNCRPLHDGPFVCYQIVNNQCTAIDFFKSCGTVPNTYLSQQDCINNLQININKTKKQCSQIIDKYNIVNPPRDCVYIYLWKPVCGNDGRTYSNAEAFCCDTATTTKFYTDGPCS